MNVYQSETENMAPLEKSHFESLKLFFEETNQHYGNFLAEMVNTNVNKYNAKLSTRFGNVYHLKEDKKLRVYAERDVILRCLIAKFKNRDFEKNQILKSLFPHSLARLFLHHFRSQDQLKLPRTIYH